MAMHNINTYKDLKDAILLFLNRKDQATTDMLPNFVNFAEKQFTRLVKLPYYQTQASFTITENFKFVVIPQDFLSAISITVNGVPYNRVDQETFARLRSATRDTSRPYRGLSDEAYYGSNDTGNMKVVCRFGEQLHFLPSPEVGDVVELYYQQDIPEMEFDDDQPYSLLIAPEVLLYLCLRHASIWLRDQEQEQYWNVKAQEAAAAVMQQLDDAEWGGSSIVVPFFGE